MNFYNSYVSLCNRIGKSPSAVALEIGLTKPTVNRWKNGGGVTDATAAKIADYFNVPVEALLGQDLTGASYDQITIDSCDLQMFSEQKKKPIQEDGLESTGYKKLTPDNRAMIDDLIEKLLKSQSGS